MERALAAKIAKDLIEGGISSHGIINILSDHYGVSTSNIRNIKRILLSHGNNESSVLGWFAAIENGWVTDAELNIKNPKP